MTNSIKATLNNTEYKVHIDERFQPRSDDDFDYKATSEYSQMFLDGIEAPAIEVVAYYHKGKGKPTYYLCSGFHRAYAFQEATKVQPNITPMNMIVVASGSDWNELLQQAIIKGTESNKSHGVRISKSSYRKACQSLYDTGMDVKSIAKELGITRRTVDKYTEEQRMIAIKSAVSEVVLKLTVDPDCSLPKLMLAGNNVLGKPSVRTLKALHGLLGESAGEFWLSNDRPLMKAGQSVVEFYNEYSDKEIPVKPNEPTSIPVEPSVPQKAPEKPKVKPIVTHRETPVKLTEEPMGAFSDPNVVVTLHCDFLSELIEANKELEKLRGLLGKPEEPKVVPSDNHWVTSEGVDLTTLNGRSLKLLEDETFNSKDLQLISDYKSVSKH